MFGNADLALRSRSATRPFAPVTATLRVRWVPRPEGQAATAAMERDRMVVGLIGLVMSGLGMAAVLIPGFAEWYVRSSGKGRLWARMLGEERAVVAMRSVFGPLTLVLGLVCVFYSGALG